MDIKEELKKLSKQELEDITWLIFKSKEITGKNLEEEIITNHLLLDKLLNTDNEEEAKTIENILLERMRRKLEGGI